MAIVETSEFRIQYSLDLSSNGKYARFLITDGLPGGSYAWAWDSTDILSLGAWHHLVGTYDGITVCLYRDGVLRAANDPSPPHPATFSIGNNNMPVCIGGRFTKNNFKGLADDVRIFNRALTADEVTQLYIEELTEHH